MPKKWNLGDECALTPSNLCLEKFQDGMRERVVDFLEMFL